MGELLNTKEVLKMAQMSTTDFKDFHRKYQNEKGFIVEEFEMEQCRLDDEKAIEKIKETLQIENIISITNFDKKKRNEMILQAITIEGIQRKQLARILGMNEKMIYRISKLT